MEPHVKVYNNNLLTDTRPTLRCLPSFSFVVTDACLSGRHVCDMTNGLCQASGTNLLLYSCSCNHGYTLQINECSK